MVRAVAARDFRPRAGRGPFETLTCQTLPFAAVSHYLYATYRKPRTGDVVMGNVSGELLPGTFEMLILKALSLGTMHGWGVAERIERLSGGICEIQQGAVYPVLQRLL